MLSMSLWCMSMATASAQSSNASCNTNEPLTSGNGFTSLSVNSSQNCIPLLGCSDNFSNKANLINTNTGDASGWSAVLLGSAWVEIKDNNATGANLYPAGTYAGFVISDLDLVSLGASVTISTYSGSTLKETQVFNSLLGTILDGTGKRHIGFLTTQSFDRIRLTTNAGLTLIYTLNAYYAEVNKPCAGPTPACNALTALVQNAYPAFVSASGTTGVTLGTVSNPENVVDYSTTNSAGITLAAGIFSTGYIAVKDPVTDYPAGYFAGFEVSNTTLVGVGLLNNSRVTTYLNGVQQETKAANALLLSAPLLSGSGRNTVGFVAGLPFDEIRYTVEQPVGITLGTTNVYNAVVTRYCAGPALVCNTPTNMTAPTYPVYISGSNTGISGAVCAGCLVSNTGNLLDAATTNFASISLTAGVAVSGSVAVKDQVTDYPAGTYAGFEIRNPNLIGANLLGGLTLTTYLNGIQQEVRSGSTQLVSASSSLINGTGAQRAGFVTALPFDEVKLTVTQGVSANIGTTEVYGLVLKSFCAGTLTCNTLTQMYEPAQPVYVDMLHTGIDGIGCVGCSLNNTQNIIDNNALSAATMVLTAGAITSGSVAVADAVTTYLAGTFAGFDISTNTLLAATALSSATIQLLNNGAVVQTGTGNALMAGVTTSLLTGTTRQVVGLVGNVPFDEVKIIFNQVAGADLGNIQIYSTVWNKPCVTTLLCDSLYSMVPPAIGAVIDGGRTGIQGAACVACYVRDPWNVVDANLSNYAKINLPVGALSTGSIAVVDGANTYPAGTVAGFTIRDNNFLVSASLLSALTITTYNNGVQQEVKSGANLIDLTVLVNIFGGAGIHNVGFVTTQPWDEVRITVASVATVLDQNIDVYRAYVDTRFVPANTPGLSCVKTRTEPDLNVGVINKPITGNVHTNDQVPAGTTYGPPTLSSGPSGSTPSITMNPDGTYTFTTNVPGEYVYTVPVCPPGQTAGCPVETLKVTVNDPAVSNPPVANNDVASTLQGTPVTVNTLVNDGPGVNGAPLNPSSVTVIQAPAHGTASVNPATGAITYTPAAGYVGTDTLRYQVCDSSVPAPKCASAYQVITVLPAGGQNITNATDDYTSTAYNTAVNGNVLLNDKDPEGNTQTVTPQNVTTAQGTLVLNSNGTYTFTPATGVSGTAVFPYKVCDNGTPQACDSATLYVRIDPAPVVTRPDINDGIINKPITGNVHTNDQVPSGTTYGPPTLSSGPSGSTPSITLNPDGTYTFTTNVPGEYVYTVPVCAPGQTTGCPTEQLVINVVDPTSYNNNPVANNDLTTTDYNSPVTYPVLANDGPGNLGGTLQNPTVVGGNNPGSTVTVNPDGSLTYTPAPGFSGKDTITYQVCETPSNVCTTADWIVTVLKPTDPNTIAAADDYISTSGTIAANGSVRLNDVNPDGTDTLMVAPQNITIPGKGAFVLNSDGTYTFSPLSGFTGTVALPYTVCDQGVPQACTQATLYVVVKQMVIDLTPTTDMDNLNFRSGENQDFIVNIFEILGSNTLQSPEVSFRINKISGWDITVPGLTLTTTNQSGISGTSNVGGGTPNANSKWYFRVSSTSPNSGYIIMTLKPGEIIPGNGGLQVGFNAARRSGTINGTNQNITVTIVAGSGGEENPNNNRVNTTITATP